MENEQKLANILEFYKKANRLKTTISDQKHDESFADFLFGSMLLATLINSEFCVTQNIDKVYRMILLKGIHTLNPDYDFDNEFPDEACFAHYCDKMETDLQSKMYQDLGYHHSLEDQHHNQVFINPEIKEMVIDGATTPFDIWYLWDRKHFAYNIKFPEFMELLDMAKNYDLSNTKQKLKVKED